MDQPHSLAPHRMQHLANHACGIPCRRQITRASVERLRSPVDPKRDALRASVCNRSCVVLIVALLAGHMIDPVVAREATQLRQHLTLPKRLEQPVAGEVESAGLAGGNSNSR